MKKLLYFIIVPFICYAGEDCSTTSVEEQVLEKQVIDTAVPSHLKGAKIIVRLADGRESEVSAEAFKVVPRKQQFLVTKVAKNSTTMCSADQKRNRIAVLAGRGPKEGLNRTSSANRVDVESRVGTVGGLQYQRLITDKFSIGVQVQSNETGLLSIGLDF